MEKELLDKLLEIIELNKSKKKVINNMARLEMANEIDKEEYINQIDFYKRLSSKLAKITDNINVEDELVMTKVISRLNPSFYEPTFMGDIISSNNDDTVVYRKLLVDLGSRLMTLYQESPQQTINQQIVNVLAMFGLEVEISNENNINEEEVNYYMCSDLTNSLYSAINSFLKKENLDKNTKESLLRIKYNLIYIAPNLERRAIQTAFSIPSKPRLANIDEIVSTGMKYEDYLSTLDSIIIDYLESIITTSLHESNMNNQPIDLIDLIFIKAYVLLLNDKELIDCISLDITNANSINYIIRSNIIKEVLKESRNDLENNIKIRKYGII